MSKRIMAIQEAFLQNSLAQTNPAKPTSNNEMLDKKSVLGNTKDKPSPPLPINGNKPYIQLGTFYTISAP